MAQASIERHTCSVWGRHHYTTFDGNAFSYNGEGAYILVSEIRGGPDMAGVTISMDQGYQCEEGECQTRVMVSGLSVVPSVLLEHVAYKGELRLHCNCDPTSELICCMIRDRGFYLFI